MQEPGQPGACVAGGAGGCEIRGNSKIRQPEPPRERRAGATRGFTIGTAGGCRIWGNPETAPGSVAIGAEIRGNPEIRHRQRG